MIGWAPAAVWLPGPVLVPGFAALSRGYVAGLGHEKTPGPEAAGVGVETLVPQSEGYTMTGADARTGNP